MSHVFVAPHPDDVALSCGGLIAGLGGWLLVRAMARTGVLSGFPSGRQQPEV